MGKRRRRAKQASMWVATSDLPRSAAHPFYMRLNQILDEHDFDGYVEGLCQRFYADDGRPGLPPGRYFRLLLIGYFEGLGRRARDRVARGRFVCAARVSRAGVAGRAAGSFDDLAHASADRSRDAPGGVHVDAAAAGGRGLVKGKTVGIDATTLEANAALRSIVRRDTGESYQDFLTKLAQASGIETPTRADLARIDRKRKKKGSNDDWTHPHDPDAKITKMKDGRTHLAHKAEHAVDLETGAIVGVTVQDADDGDTTTQHRDADRSGRADRGGRGPDGDGLEEVVGDKGYHSNQALVDLEAVGVRGYISEPDRGRRNWKKNPEARDAVYRNRRRIRGARGLRLLRLRGERLERPFAHLYETGGMRRVHLRGHTNIRKRLLIHAGGFNLGLLMRQLIGVGTPRGLQGRLHAVLAALLMLIRPL